jgi:hypothetical protein
MEYIKNEKWGWKLEVGCWKLEDGLRSWDLGLRALDLGIVREHLRTSINDF